MPRLDHATDGQVVDAAGREATLFELLDGHITVLSFVYTRCADTNGCPLATYVLSRLHQRLAADPATRGAVRLVSLSFDPAHDTPAALRAYAAPFGGQSDTWRFLTTRSPADLAPLLDAYGQGITPDPDGRAFSHLLRVFLIDRAKRIRNIYSASFLHADTVGSDIGTLLGEHARGADGPAAERPAALEPAAHGARAPPATALLQLLSEVPLGLPPITELRGPVPAQAQVLLGRKLFFDRRLSRNDTISCAMCHIPAQGFTNNELATAVGIEGRTVKRNAPALYNVGFLETLFHDAREDRLEQQVWGPLLAANEMGNPSVGYVLGKIKRLADYAGLFEHAFGGQPPTMETIGAALASYERTLLSGGSPFDRWYYGNDETALGPAARRGYALFTGRAGCANCHVIGASGALFTDQKLHNTGIGYRRSMHTPAATQPVQLAPGTVLDIDLRVVADAAERPPNDLGRYEITEDPADRWRYRTPGLRNVDSTAPYMHDGSVATLREVVAFYNAGGVPHELLDPLVRPLGLDDRAESDLVRFLQSLTGEHIDVITADAVAAPVGDP